MVEGEGMDDGKVISSNSVEETIAIGSMLGELLEPGDVIELTGELGAGKTHLAKGVAAALGVLSPITSPTFNIIYEYHEGRMPLYHFDLYRLDAESDLDDIAYWELLEDGGASLIEWGDKFPDSLPEDYLLLDLSADTDETRHICVEGVGERGRTLAEGLLANAAASGMEAHA